MATANRKVARIEGTAEEAEQYWKANLRLIVIMLSIWALVSYGAAIILAGPLYYLQMGNVPLSYWFAHQGAIYIFVALIFVYAKLMDGIDNKYNVHE